MHTLLTWEWACLFGGLEFQALFFWIFSHSKTSGIKSFHLASAGSKCLGSVPEFHSDHFLILKQNILTSHATCRVLSARLTASKCLSHIQNKLHPFSSRLNIYWWELVPRLYLSAGKGNAQKGGKIGYLIFISAKLNWNFLT